MLTPSTITGFPADDVSKEVKKSPQYGQATATAIFNRWYSSPIPYGAGGTVYGNLAYFNILKSYAEGRQSPLKYKKTYRGENGALNSNVNMKGHGENGRKGYNNIGFDQNSIVNPAPMYISTIKSLLTQSDYKVVVSSTTQADVETKERMKWGLYTQAKFTNPLKEELGIPFKKPEWYPESKAELEIYEKYHGFRLPLETALAKVAEHGFDISDWASVRSKMLDSAIQTAFVCGRIRTHNDGSVRCEYINPAMYITVWDDDNPEAEPPFAGHITRVSIQTLRQKFTPEEMSDEQLKGLAQIYASSNIVGDPAVYNWTTKDPVTARYAWYDFFVDVLHFEHKTDDAKIFVGRQASNGNYVYKQDDRVKKNYADGRERKTDKYYEQNIYEGSWIINSNYIYDYGLQKNMIRDGEGNACLSYFAERIAGRSLVERWVSLLDDLQMATYKLRAAILAAAPKGLSIDVGMLSNMDLGLGKMSALEVARIRRETGNQFLSSRFEIGQRYNPNQAVQELENGIGKQLDEWISYMVHIESQMYRVAGLTDTSVATPNASPEKLVGMGQMEIDSTNNALYNLRYAIIRIKEKAARKMIQKMRVNIEGDSTCAQYYKNYLGETDYTSIKNVQNLSLSGIGIKLKATTTAQRKAFIMSMVTESLKAGKNGLVGITSADAMYVEKTLEEGYDELAAWYLNLAEERAARRRQEESEMMSKLNAENGAKAAQAAAEAKAQADQLGAQARIEENNAKIAAEHQAAMELQTLKHQHVMEELQLEGTLQAVQGKEITGRI